MHLSGHDSFLYVTSKLLIFVHGFRLPCPPALACSVSWCWPWMKKFSSALYNEVFRDAGHRCKSFRLPRLMMLHMDETFYPALYLFSASWCWLKKFFPASYSCTVSWCWPWMKKFSPASYPCSVSWCWPIAMDEKVLVCLIHQSV